MTLKNVSARPFGSSIVKLRCFHGRSSIASVIAMPRGGDTIVDRLRVRDLDGEPHAFDRVCRMVLVRLEHLDEAAGRAEQRAATVWVVPRVCDRELEQLAVERERLLVVLRAR